MKVIKSLFWNNTTSRIRALWRILIYLAMVALLVNPVILVLDGIYEGLLTQTMINIVVALGFFSALWLFIRFIDKATLDYYGIFLQSRSWKNCLAGAGIGMLLVGVIVLFLKLTGKIHANSMFYISPNLKVGFALAITAQLLRYVFGSIFEEIMTRSFLIKHLAEGIQWQDKIGNQQAIWLSCVVTSALFGILHLANPGASAVSTINLTLIGLLFALSYVFTGDLAWPIGLHLGWNFCQNNLFGFPNSGKPAVASVATFNLEGAEIWTGGAFGIEASLITTLVLCLVLTYYCWKHFQKHGGFEFKIRLGN